MNPPPFLLGCTLLFWGWQSHLLLFAVPMALILEIAYWIKWHWAFSDKDFNRVTDLTSLSLIMAMLYLVNQQSIHGLMTLLNWLPMLFFLLITAQIYSTQGTIKLSSLFLSLRGTKSSISYHKANERVNLSYPYMMVCLLSASISQNAWFFIGVCLLVGYGLWTVRPSRYSIVTWVLLLGMASTLAYISQLGLYRLQSQMEQVILNWFQDRFFANSDPYRQSTAIGDIGRLKQSDKIILRVESRYPLLLRETSYNIYFKTTWRVKKSPFTEVPFNINHKTWHFVKIPSNTPLLKGRIAANGPLLNKEIDDSSPFYKKDFLKSVKVSTYLHNGNGMLALPHGTYQVSDLILPALHRNNFGAVKVENGPGLIEYMAHFSQNTPLDSLPTQDDLRLPLLEKEHLLALSHQLNLSQQNSQQVLNILTTFFSQFQYSLNLTAPFKKNITPLEYFLRDSRAGHCEYFATATVLLLRAAGIPSRYASGYAVEEFSHLENAYLVRKRHAHAWTLAYIDGKWQTYDTTPAAWLSLEEEMAAWWEPLYDLSSWITYQFSRWRWRETSNNNWLLWLILPLSLVLIWRLYSREKIARLQKKSAKPPNRLKRAGADSAFYQIVQQLNTAGFIRQPGETLTTWLRRIQTPPLSKVDMQTMITLHQRYRFDPVGISTQEKATLATYVKLWFKINKERA